MAKKKKKTAAGRAQKSQSRAQSRVRRPPSASRSKAPPNRRKSAEADAVPEPETKGPNPGYAVVGIGASAGGLDAFKRFFSAMPAEPGMAFVLIQHLDPTHQSLTSELLARHTQMPVVEATDDLHIEPDHVYVIPPNHYLALSGEKLRLSEPPERRGMRVPVDFFFRSLADDRHERAIGILLSGTGSDGTNGVREIKAAGGMVMVQEPETTEWEGMPRSAIATGVVDYILPVEQMPKVLNRYVRHWYVKGAPPAPVADKAPDHLNTIIGILRSRAKYDFGGYKPGTLIRRIQRRMGLNHIPDMKEYIEYLRQSQGEVNALFKDMLISVTSFFREPKAWEALEQAVIVPLAATHGPEKPIRVWSAGCATGEEAYSLAMLILSHAQKQDKVFDIHVFASDIDHDALAFARAGVYPESSAADVPRDLLRRHLIHGEHTYRVSKDVRDLIVFAEQNVISDPPFSKLDLISCRNMLIYLDSDVQKRILSLFHFALNEGGYLFLGNSETVNQQSSLFEPVSRKLRLYRRLGGRKGAPIGLLQYSSDRVHQRMPAVLEPRTRRLTTLAQEILARRFAPACAIINRNLEVIYLHGAVDAYLQLPSGEPATDLAGMVRDGLRTKLRAAINKAVSENHRITAGGIALKRGDGSFTVRVTVEPLKKESDREGLLLVVFEEERDRSPAPAAPPTELSAPGRASDYDYELIISHLEEHLRTTREDLQSTIEELETSNEEFKAANEEVTSVNEELQSTNEELETSKEELQSLNEEMQTVNHQLEQKVAELESTNNDLDNLLSITEVATILLDRDLRIKRFTQATTKLFRVIETDVGRPISDLAKSFTDDELLSDAQRVLESLTPLTKEIEDNNGRNYLRRVVPYRADDNRIDGVVITITDVSDRVERERNLRDYSTRLEGDVAKRTVQLEDLGREMADLSERERQHLGRQLHDTLGQQLTAIGVLAATLKEHHCHEPVEAEVFEKLDASIEEAKRQTRSLSKGLFPVDVDAQGLRISLEELAKEVTSIFRIPCRFECQGAVPVEDNFTATQLFLIAQEALQNAARHAKATQLTVKLDDGEGIRLSVEDNGRGLPKDVEGGGGMGLRIMRHRSDLIGGELQVESLDGRGTRVLLHVGQTKSGD
ncbi:MAG TPA: chemotaxis protein CheB [Planctomycetaceae bacterium]|jgi:two-component system CheB/CheR fusion protein|nr:chemotaxis protein CheB [Planctomycetaceae bacterium]